MAAQFQGHALLVGSPGANLDGVDRDLRSMSAMLQERRFAVEVRIGAQATRDGILAGYDELIARCRPDQAAVFYYSGHGYREILEKEHSRSWQGISPTDMNASDTNDFRGITAWELSIKQAQLTARTRNVTVILDCCHAAQMSRDAAAYDAVPRALPHPYRLGFPAHFDALRAKYGTAFDDVDPIGSRNAVRLVACGHDESAFEYRVDGERRGVFTEALCDVLSEVGDARVSWADLEIPIRERVHRRFLVQRPEIEGPVRRRPFSLDECDTSGSVAITTVADGIRLEAGRLTGVVEGDVYGVMPPGSVKYRAADVIAEVEACEVEALSSRGVLRGEAKPDPARLDGALAFPIKKLAVRRAVRLDVPVDARTVVTREIEASRTLRIAGGDEAVALAILRLVGGELTIEDRLGPLFPATRFPSTLALTVENLANIGAAEGLRELEGEHGVLAQELEIEWGAVDRGQMRRMPGHGAALGLQDRIYVQIRSKAGRPLYGHIFNIGLRGKITLLTHAWPAGVELRSGAPDFVLGQRPDGTVQGMPLGWPTGMSRDTFPRIDELVVIVTSVRTSLRSLETVEQLGTSRSAGSKLEDLLGQLHDGRSRNVRSPEPIDGFFVKRLSYVLHPRDAVMADIPFEIDDNPLRQAAVRAPDAWLTPRGEAPSGRAIAIRIADVAIERRLPSADIRIDALICTRSTSAASVYATWTQRCAGIEDIDWQKLDRELVFQGPVQDFIDLCLWVSPDMERGPTLEWLLAQRATRSEFQDAVAALVTGAGSPSGWVAAAGASAVLARMAYDALVDVAGASIGLHRTSFLAHEQFGAGRHPSCGLHRASVVFSLEIELVELGRGD